MSPEKALIERLRRLGCALATVESCTGGQLAQRITSIPGASEVFWGGLVAYDNSAKESFAGVPRELLLREGAVSKAVALAMAEGGLSALARALDAREAGAPGVRSGRLRACVATTGIAGPGGGTPAKPVGLCFIGVAVSGRPAHVLELRAAPGRSREEYQAEFSVAALKELVRLLPEETA